MSKAQKKSECRFERAPQFAGRQWKVGELASGGKASSCPNCWSRRMQEQNANQLDQFKCQCCKHLWRREYPKWSAPGNATPFQYGKPRIFFVGLAPDYSQVRVAAYFAKLRLQRCKELTDPELTADQ